MKVQHTQGPWETHQETEGRCSVRICKPDSSERGCHSIAEAEILGIPRLEAEANARLIAAAPELLAALVKLRKAAPQPTRATAMAYQEAYFDASFLIERAKGETK